VTGRDVTTTERIQCGAFAGLIAQSVAYPIEVTRRRMQTVGLLEKSGDTALGAVGSQYSSKSKIPPSLAEIVRDLYAEQGIRGFYKGVSMNWVKGPVAFSISFTMFDAVQSIMETPNEQAMRAPRRLLTRRLPNKESS
jgi:solute carrier family 25, member 42